VLRFTVVDDDQQLPDKNQMLFITAAKSLQAECCPKTAILKPTAYRDVKIDRYSIAQPLFVNLAYTIFPCFIKTSSE